MSDKTIPPNSPEALIEGVKLISVRLKGEGVYVRPQIQSVMFGDDKHYRVDFKVRAKTKKAAKKICQDIIKEVNFPKDVYVYNKEYKNSVGETIAHEAYFVLLTSPHVNIPYMKTQNVVERAEEVIL